MTLILHDFWRSSAAYRVRIALNLKGVVYEQQSRDLRAGAQRLADYLAIAPSGLVPALDADGMIITQSLAIVEWLEERFPEPALLPRDADGRAAVRSIAGLISCDVHPLNNVRVQQWLRSDLGADSDAVQRWIAHWIMEGFGALETIVQRHGGLFCHGDAPTIADCTLVPQIYNARRFNVDLTPYPSLVAIDARCAEIAAFAAAVPERQPDAP